MIDNSKEYILCAAIKRLKKKQCHDNYHEGENDILSIEIGYRHPDILHRFEGEVSTHPYDQGFYTSKGKYVDRNKAYKIHFNLEESTKQLYSENLY